ncbi:hypothetical protein RRG08_021792 [Elysia crispata]|uniref:Uncharacterized protein n=1 Tax=Elysia crispata TaxID=231223 RepID=A0AAE0ZZ73_9GAST|nr:hypothetical protein RRG08_021792 [Elysia crispata]
MEVKKTGRKIDNNCKNDEFKAWATAALLGLSLHTYHWLTRSYQIFRLFAPSCVERTCSHVNKLADMFITGQGPEG